jgi:hypothetical protein
MTVRTTSKTVTFMHPFSLTGTDELHPAGTYTVETDEELLRPSSFPAYRRIATLLRLERTTGRILTQIVETNPVELAAALARDGQPDEKPRHGLTATVSCLGKGQVAAVWTPSGEAGEIGWPSTPLI